MKIKHRSMINGLLLAGVSLLLSPLTSMAAFSWEDHYNFENIPMPEGVDPQIGGITQNANQQLVVCFHRGEIMIYDEPSKQWHMYASGLQEPLGVYVEKSGTILVIQRGELTRLHDKDKDGTADFYETVSSDWGLSGNYHEFNFGIVKDSQGNIYLGLGTASNGAGVREEIRGKWNDTGGLSHEDFISGGEHGEWSVKKRKVARMYARVPYRGCILQIKPNSSKAHVYATGVRTPNGLYMDENDQLWVSDNQGDWLGASKLHRIQKDGFHGHPASLLWAKNSPAITPSKLPVAELDAMRIKAVALFPQGDCANSMTDVLPLSQEFIPVAQESNAAKQLMIGEMNHSRLIHYLPDVVNGTEQGAAGHLINTPSLVKGNNSLIYSNDQKAIYVGKTHLKWPGDEGIKKVTYKDKPYLLVESVKLTPKGFEFTFNSSIEASVDVQDYEISSYGVRYHAGYGSPKVNLTTEPSAKVTTAGNTLTIELLHKPKGNKVYDIKLPATITSELSDLSSCRFWYTAHSVYQ